MVVPENMAVTLYRQFNDISQVEYMPLSLIKNQEENLLNLINSVDFHFVLSVQYPWILSKKILNATKNRVLNLHNAKLPEYRGHNTISHEIINKEKVHTSTLHWMDEEVDRGRIVLTRDIDIFSHDTAFSLWKRSVESSVKVLVEFFSHCETIVDDYTGEPVESGGYYFSKNSIQNLKKIPDNASIEAIDRISRAFWFPPHEPAYFLKDNRRLYILPESYDYTLTIG
jgi:methionyl-tRNA formyltransferase